MDSDPPTTWRNRDVEHSVRAFRSGLFDPGMADLERDRRVGLNLARGRGVAGNPSPAAAPHFSIPALLAVVDGLAAELEVWR